MRILMIENSHTLNQNLENALKEVGYQVDSVEDLKTGKYNAEVKIYSAILLSESLFKEDGQQIVKTFKAFHDSLPVAILVLANNKNSDDESHNDKTNGDEASEIAALKAGADGYVRNGGNIDLVLAHLEARLYKANPNIMTMEQLVINKREQTVHYDGEVIDMTRLMFDVFFHLASHQGEVLSRDQLLDASWEEPCLRLTDAVDGVISRLRHKIDKPFGITTIEAVRGRGYRFCFPKY